MRWINFLWLAMLVSLLSACSSSQENTLPQPDTNVKDVWLSKTGGANKQSFMDARSTLRRQLSPDELTVRVSDYTRDSYREISNQFPRLPNPDIVFFVFPHRTGSLPVPGYSTVFPLYERVHYATPGDMKARLLTGGAY